MSCDCVDLESADYAAVLDLNFSCATASEIWRDGSMRRLADSPLISEDSECWDRSSYLANPSVEICSLIAEGIDRVPGYEGDPCRSALCHDLRDET